MAQFVLGFDVGETLLTYVGIPLNWVAHYPAALAATASSFEGGAGAQSMSSR